MRHNTEELYTNLGKAGLFWADGHYNNIFLFDGPDGKPRAGILDHDMIVPVAALPNLPDEIKGVMLDTTLNAGATAKAKGVGLVSTLNDAFQGKLSASEIMDRYLLARYGEQPPKPAEPAPATPAAPETTASAAPEAETTRIAPGAVPARPAPEAAPAQQPVAEEVTVPFLRNGQSLTAAVTDEANTPAQQEAARILLSDPAATALLQKYNGRWADVVTAYKNKAITDAQMDTLIALRLKVVKAIAAEIIAQQGGGTKAMGSTNRTSDYDLSFYGANAELAVMEFNARFGEIWSRGFGSGRAESGIRLDTNTYTRSVTENTRGLATDVVTQFTGAELAVRRFQSPEAWAEHVTDTLNAVPEAAREQTRAILEAADANFRRYQAMEQSARELIAADENLPVGSKEVELAAKNRLYEGSLLDIRNLRKQYIKLLNAGKTRAAMQELRGIEQQMRDMQVRALYFASEAYLTGAPIDYVVNGIQAAARIITKQYLLGGPAPKLAFDVTNDRSAQSFLEQYAYMTEYLASGKSPLDIAIKVGKYNIRGLDALRLAGIDLNAYSAIVDVTVIVDGYRSNGDLLNARFAARAMVRALEGQLAGMAPDTPAALALQERINAANTALDGADAQMQRLGAIGALRGARDKLADEALPAGEKAAVEAQLKKAETVFGARSTWDQQAADLTASVTREVTALTGALAGDAKLTAAEATAKTATDFNAVMPGALREFVKLMAAKRVPFQSFQMAGIQAAPPPAPAAQPPR